MLRGYIKQAEQLVPHRPLQPHHTAGAPPPPGCLRRCPPARLPAGAAARPGRAGSAGARHLRTGVARPSIGHMVSAAKRAASSGAVLVGTLAKGETSGISTGKQPHLQTQAATVPGGDGAGGGAAVHARQALQLRVDWTRIHLCVDWSGIWRGMSAKKQCQLVMPARGLREWQAHRSRFARR